MSKHNNKNNNSSSGIILYAFHLHLLLLVLGFFAITGLVSSKLLTKTSAETTNGQSLGYILGDDDEEEDEDEDENENETEDDDENENEGYDDNNADADEDEAEDEGSDDSNEDEYEFEDDEDEDDNKSKTQERVQNSDGTYSIVKTETEGDKIKIETKTYSAAGKLLKEEKHEGSDEGIESETEDSSGNKLKVKVTDTNTLIKNEGVTGLSKFPLYINELDGSVYVETPTGDVKLGVMPQAVVDKASLMADVDSIESVEIESADDDNLEFKISTKHSEKLFGIFKLEIPSDVYFDAQSGEQTHSEQTFFNKVLAFLSF